MDAADLQDLRNQLQALVLDKITQDHVLHGATQAATIAQEESTTLRRHLATYKDTAERQEIELRETANQHKQEVMMMRKESSEVKLALESELAGLRAGKLQHDHEVRVRCGCGCDVCVIYLSLPSFPVATLSPTAISDPISPPYSTSIHNPINPNSILLVGCIATSSTRG